MKLRVRPKEKSFINGFYRYNPVIDTDLIKCHMGCRSECTLWIGHEALRESGCDDVRAVVGLIAQRARHSRIARQLRQRLRAAK